MTHGNHDWVIATAMKEKALAKVEFATASFAEAGELIGFDRDLAAVAALAKVIGAK